MIYILILYYNCIEYYFIIYYDIFLYNFSIPTNNIDQRNNPIPDCRLCITYCS